MPAISVARTDTFEQQRDKINLIASDLFEITGGSGGATISPSAITIQDGTKASPSLAFQSDTSLGLFKRQDKTFSFTSSENLIVSFADTGTTFARDFFVEKTFLETADVTITESGSEYDVGVYTDVAIFGGGGSQATANVTVVPWDGIVTANSNVDEYTTGSYTDIPVTTDYSGINALMSFDIVTLEVATKGVIDNAGTGYYPGTYNNVELVNGTGSGKFANITVTGSVDIQNTITNAGTGYTEGTYTSVAVDNIPSSTTTLTVVSRQKLDFVYGRLYEWNVTDDGLATDYVFTGQNAISTSGNDISISVAQGSIITINVNSPGHPFWIQSAAGGYDASSVLVVEDGVTNNGTDNGTIVFDTSEYLTGTIYYTCQNHSAMGGTIELIDNPFTEFAAGATVTSASGSGTITSFDDEQPAMYFTSVTGTFNVNEEISDGAGAFGIAKNLSGVFQYQGNGSEITTTALTFSAGGTYRFDTSDASNAGYTLGILDEFGISIVTTEARTIAYGTPGSAGSYTDLVLNSTATDAGLSGISLTPTIGLYGEPVKAGLLPGGTGSYIFDMLADVDVDANGNVISFTVTEPGSGWKANDNVTVHPSNIGGTGSGLAVNFTSVNVIGTITDVVETVAGSGYVEGDILTFSNVITRGYGVGFQYRISNRRGISNISFSNYGSGYVVGDKLFLPADPGTYGGDNGFEFEITKEGSIGSIEIVNGGRDYFNGDVLNLDREALVADLLNLSGNQIDAQITVTGVGSETIISASNTGSFNVVGAVNSTTSLTETGAASTSFTTPLSIADTLNVDLIGPNSGNSFAMEAGLGNIRVDAGQVYYGPLGATTIEVIPLTGNFTTSGVLKTTNELNVNGYLTITNTNIATFAGFDLILTPDTGKSVVVNATSSIQIPAGSTSARPPLGFAADGQIRYNTDTTQYEGYSSQTASWTSLGGIRDLDGNTYVTAEQTVGSNDNTFWFYNDAVNTLKLSPFYLEFEGVKKVRSPNLSAPAYTDWTSSTPVTAGDYLKFGHDIYEVITTGTTGAAGEEPNDTSGSVFSNGTSTLQYNTTAVDNLIFEEINELRIGPDIDVPLVISSDLRLVGNTISTDVSDLVIRPNPGQKTVISSSTSIAIPTGTTADRGIAVQGSIRFNQTTFTYEGYDGTNWGSLGGVKDIDQNTYIIPETSPGANENTLFFYNDGNNTLNLTTSALEFRGVDVINSPVTNELEINADTIVFAGGNTTLDNTDTASTFLHTSKQYFDIGLSAGLTVDPVLRLDNAGDVYFNIGFGTGNFNGVKVFDSELKDFELTDYRILSGIVELVKDTVDIGSFNCYDGSTEASSKVMITAINNVTGDREVTEYFLTDDGTDIYHTEYGNIRTGVQLFSTTFEFTATNIARVNLTVGDNVGTSQDVDIKIVSQITKK